jgi:hypothetical protein
MRVSRRVSRFMISPLPFMVRCSATGPPTTENGQGTHVCPECFVNAKDSGSHVRQSVGGRLCVRHFPRRLRDGSYLKIKD